jgi:hypothetical protein
VSTEIQSFDNETILKEIKFLKLNNGQECSDEIKDKLKLYKSLEVILSGQYLKDVVRPKSKVEPVSEKLDETLEEVISLEAEAETPEVTKDEPTVPRPNETATIQDLLDDIRGSFERQFDDEFEDLTAADLATDD